MLDDDWVLRTDNAGIVRIARRRLGISEIVKANMFGPLPADHQSVGTYRFAVFEEEGDFNLSRHVARIKDASRFRG